MKKTPKAEQRRRDLCDAAIAVLAAEGARGLTHRGVDRHAGFPEGTTSFYYQTRTALLRAAMDRVIELDVADFTTAVDTTGDGEVDSLLATLAVQAMRTAVEPERSRARARFELMMIASRDPDLGAGFDGLMGRFSSISEAAVAQAQPIAAQHDPSLIKAQAFAVTTFLGGFLFQLAHGLTPLDSAETLEQFLHSVIAGVAADHGRTDTRPST